MDIHDPAVSASTSANGQSANGRYWRNSTVYTANPNFRFGAVSTVGRATIMVRSNRETGMRHLQPSRAANLGR